MRIDLDRECPLPEPDGPHRHGGRLYNMTVEDVLAYGKKVREQAFKAGVAHVIRTAAAMERGEI